MTEETKQKRNRRRVVMPEFSEIAGTRDELIATEVAQFVISLRKAGYSYHSISQQVNQRYPNLKCTPKTAFAIVRTVIEYYRELMLEDLNDVLWLELARLDAALEAIWPQVEQGKIAAINQLIRISESRRKLLGLDQPSKLTLDGKDTIEVILNWDDAS